MSRPVCSGGNVDTTLSVSAAEQALVRAYVACQLALDSIEDLPRETAEAVQEPIREFCRRLGPFVEPLRDIAETGAAGD